MLRRSMTLFLTLGLLLSLCACGFHPWREESHAQMPQVDFQYEVIESYPDGYIGIGSGNIIMDRYMQGHITGDNLRVRSTAGDGEVIGHLNAGDLVEILSVTHVGSTMWCFIGWGWISMDYVQLDGFEYTGCFVALFPEGVYILQTPGNLYDGNTRLAQDSYLCVWELRTIGHVMWGLTDLGWVDMAEAAVPGNPDLLLGTTDEQASTEPTEPTPTETKPKPDSTVQPTPNSTPLVGDWTQFSPSDFISGGYISTQHWVFYADGTFNTSDCEYAYFPDQDGLYGASGGWSQSGVYTYDGNTLVLYYQSHFGDDPDDCGPMNKVESYTGKISNDMVNFGSFNLCRGSDVNQWICYAVKQNAGLGGSQLVSMWHNSERSYTFYADGTYEESSAQGHRQGHYICIDGKLYMAYNKNHFDQYIFRVSGDTLTTEAMSYYGPEIQEYNRGTE